jgi:hypothetical protein
MSAACSRFHPLLLASISQQPTTPTQLTMVKINYGFEKRRKEMEKKRKKEEKAKAKAAGKNASSDNGENQVSTEASSETAPATE